MDLFWDTYRAYLRSYLPQWRYDPGGGEPESAVLQAAAELIEASRARMAGLPQTHELAFLEGWELEPLEADPACACAALTALGGGPVPAGTELYASGDGARLWRTAEDARADPLELREQFLTGRGKRIPLPLPARERPVRLFDFHGEGLPGPELQFSHPDAFSSQGGCRIELTLPRRLSGLLEQAGGEGPRWRLVDASGEAAALAPPAKTGDTLHIQLPAVPDGCALRVQLPAAVTVDADGAAAVRTERQPQPPAMVWDGDAPLSGTRWLPFGPSPEPWRACYLSCPDAMTLRSAWLTVSFSLSFQVYEEQLPGMDESPEYRPVMRRMPAPPPVREVRAEQVLWEYWNGRTWLPIPGTEGLAGRFAAAEQGTVQVEARFLWPEDAAPCEVGGQSGLWLRWRVGRAGGSGWLPRRCYAPEVGGIRFSALLDNAPVSVALRVRPGDGFCPLSDPSARPLQTADPEGDCWWLGFDRPPSGPFLRLYLALQGRTPGGALTAWEAAAGERRPLPLEDGTDGLSHSGVITVSDVQGGMDVRYGLRRWWLCLEDDGGRLGRGRRFPCLEGVFCGAVRLEEIRRLLEGSSALPALGLELVVREPVFYPINAMVWLRAGGEASPETVRRRVCEALDYFFDPAAGRFQGEGWPIGRLPAEMEVRNFLQDRLPDLVIVRSPLTAAAPDGREADCAQAGDPFSLPVPGAYTVHILRGEDLSWTP